MEMDPGQQVYINFKKNQLGFKIYRFFTLELFSKVIEERFSFVVLLMEQLEDRG